MYKFACQVKSSNSFNITGKIKQKWNNKIKTYYSNGQFWCPRGFCHKKKQQQTEDDLKNDDKRTRTVTGQTHKDGRTYKDGHWTIGISLWAPLGGTQGYIWHTMRGLIFLAICLQSFSVHNLSASGDYKHQVSFPFCKVSLPRITIVILFSSFPPSKPFSLT